MDTPQGLPAPRPQSPSASPAHIAPAAWRPRHVGVQIRGKINRRGACREVRPNGNRVGLMRVERCRSCKRGGFRDTRPYSVGDMSVNVTSLNDNEIHTKKYSAKQH